MHYYYKTHFQMIRVDMQYMKSTCAHFYDKTKKKKKEEKMNERKRKKERMENEIGLMFSIQCSVSFQMCFTIIISMRDGSGETRNEKKKITTSSYDFLADFQVLCIGIRAAMLS